MSKNYFLRSSTPLNTTNDDAPRSPFAKLLSVAQSFTPSIISSVLKLSTNDEDKKIVNQSHKRDELNRREQIRPDVVLTEERLERNFEEKIRYKRPAEFSLDFSEMNTPRPQSSLDIERMGQRTSLTITPAKKMKPDTTPCESLKFLESVERPVLKNPSTFSESFRFFDVPSTEPKSTVSAQKPEEKLHISRPPNHALAVLSSETRRLLREMERRNSPVMAAKKMKLDSNRDSPLNISNSDFIGRPPTVSLNTPYKAKVLPRLATLGSAPYARPVPKETADKGVSANLPADLTNGLSINYKNIKTVGQATNKFSARRPDLDEELDFQDYPEHQNLEKITLPFPSTVSALKPGFFGTPDLQASAKSGSHSGATSPNVDAFKFSHPIVVACPSDINSPVKLFGTDLQKPKWTCQTCFVSNSDDEKKCLACSSMKAESLPPQKKWTCENCFIQNPLETFKCLACASEKPYYKPKPDVITPLPKFQSTDKWTCNTCFISNRNDVSKCAACSSDKPDSRSASVPSFVTPMKSCESSKFDDVDDAQVQRSWSCTICFVNNPADQIKCLACQTAKPGTISEPKWTCMTCFVSNPREVSKCVACSSDKPGSESSTGPKFDAQVKPTEPKFEAPIKKNWNCTTCFVNNPVDQIKCLACRSVKPGTNFKPISFGFQDTLPVPAAVPKMDQIAVADVEKLTEKIPKGIEKPVNAADQASVKEVLPNTEKPKSVRFAEPPVSLVTSFSVDNLDSQASSANTTGVTTTEPIFGFGAASAPPAVSQSDSLAKPESGFGFSFGSKGSEHLAPAKPIVVVSTTATGFGFNFSPKAPVPAISDVGFPISTVTSSGSLTSSANATAVTTTEPIFGIGVAPAVSQSDALAKPVHVTETGFGFSFGSKGSESLAPTKPTGFGFNFGSKTPAISGGGFPISTVSTSDSQVSSANSTVVTTTEPIFGFGAAPVALAVSQSDLTKPVLSSVFEFGSRSAPATAFLDTGEKPPSTSNAETGFGFNFGSKGSESLAPAKPAVASTTLPGGFGFNFGPKVPAISGGGFPIPTVSSSGQSSGGFSFTSLVPGPPVFGSSTSTLQAPSTTFPPQIPANPFSIAATANKAPSATSRKVLTAKRKTR